MYIPGKQVHDCGKLIYFIYVLQQPKIREHVDHLEKFPMCTPSSAFLQGEDHFETNLIN